MSKTLKVVGFGDSITQGALATKEEFTWLGVVKSQLKAFFDGPVEVINQGVGDNTISPCTTNYALSNKPSALERFKEDVVQLQPDLVLIGFGLNDMRFGTPVGIFSEDLEKIVTGIQEGLPKARLVLINVFHMTGWNMHEPRDRGSIESTKLYNEAIGLLGKKSGVPVADVSAAMAFQDYLIVPDGVHGNDLGHRVIGNRVFETIVQHTLLLNGNVLK